MPRRRPVPGTAAACVLHVAVAGEYGAAETSEDHITMLDEMLAGSITRGLAEGEDRQLACFAENLSPPQGQANGSAADLARGRVRAECGNGPSGAERGHGLHGDRRGSDRRARRPAGAALGESEPELREKLRSFRSNKLEHRDTARAGMPGA